MNLTTLTYTGNISGYSNADLACASEYTGTHVCSEAEVVYYQSTIGIPFTSGDAWVIGGGPKYVPASIPVDDCKGFTNESASSSVGNYWKFDSKGGRGAAVNCGTSLRLACCK